jgi:transcriptional regulator with XRE-family HTH domain
VAPTPSWSSTAFASWLRRWKDAERLEWGEIAERSGLHVSTVMGLARGTTKSVVKRDPPIGTLARLAHGLGLDLAYILAKGGLIVGAEDRWDHFNRSERTLIHHALTSPLLDVGRGAWDEQREHLVHQLAPITDEEEITA